MYINLTLDGFRLPGIRNFIPPFGVKEVDGAGLTTRAIVDDIMLPFLTQRAIVINEASTTSEVQHDSVIALENGNVKLTLGASGYIGCRVRIIGVMLVGTGNVEFTDMSGTKQTLDITANTEITLIGGQNGAWFIPESRDEPSASDDTTNGTSTT